MLVQSWLQVPYTEHSSKSAQREKDEKMVILATVPRYYQPTGGNDYSSEHANPPPGKHNLEFTGSCTLTVIHSENSSWTTDGAGMEETG